jgi:hypothetical protein
MSLMSFPYERPRGEEAKHSNDCFTIRDVATSIDAIQRFNRPFDGEMTFSGIRYRSEVPEIIVLLLHTKSKSLSQTPNSFAVPKGFLDCFQNAALTESLCRTIFPFENGRKALLFREERFGLTQIWRCYAEYYSGIRTSESAKESSFCFISTPETTIAVWLGRFIPVPKAQPSGGLIIWNNGRLTGAIMKGHYSVTAKIDSATAKVSERLNAVLDGKESESDLRFEVPKTGRIRTLSSTRVSG